MSNRKKNNQSKDMNERELKEEIEKTYELRYITYQRLRVQNFWTRILEIYYLYVV